jgi:predicted dehydrogenase
LGASYPPAEIAAKGTDFMASIGIGLLGAARITDKAVVHPARVIPQVKLAAIAARDPERASVYADTHGIETVLEGYQALIEADSVDLVYNPLPINLHAEWTIKALEAGKHVLCEKPFAMNADETRAMLAAADKSGKRLIEAFHYRYHPAFETCLDWVRSGEIGEIREIEAVFNVGIADNGTEIRHRVETGGGAMMDLGCYPLHWALSLMGEGPSSVEAKAELTSVGVDEIMSATRGFESGAVAKLKTTMAEGTPFRADMRIIGTEGEIEFKNPLAPHMGASLKIAGGADAVINPISTYTFQLAHIVNALATGMPLATEGEMILRQQLALDAVYEAAGLRSLRYL